MSRVWGVVNTLVCNRCGQLFQCRHLRQHCRCHPLSPTPGLEGSSGLVYPCCGRRQQPFRLLDTPPVRGACGWREQCGHTVAETAISVHENTCVCGQNCPLRVWLTVQACKGHTLQRYKNIMVTQECCALSLLPCPTFQDGCQLSDHCVTAVNGAAGTSDVGTVLLAHQDMICVQDTETAGDRARCVSKP